MADTTTYRLLLVGFGAAGQGLAQILRYHGEWLRERYGVDLQIVAVCTRNRGTLFADEGLDPTGLLDAIAQTGHLLGLPGQQAAALRGRRSTKGPGAHAHGRRGAAPLRGRPTSDRPLAGVLHRSGATAGHGRGEDAVTRTHHYQVRARLPKGDK